jgi:uncharacterized membrane protein YvlD (DUF360 family)
MSTKAARSPPFYLVVSAITFFMAAMILGVIVHGVDGKVGAAILAGLLMTVLAMGKRQH